MQAAKDLHSFRKTAKKCLAGLVRAVSYRIGTEKDEDYVYSHTMFDVQRWKVIPEMFGFGLI